MSEISKILEGQTVADWRTVINELVDVSNQDLLTSEDYQRISDWLYQNGHYGQSGPAGLEGPQGPQGLRGYRGDAGPVGNYTGAALTAVVENTGQLPVTGSDGELYGVGVGQDTSIHAWNGTSWVEIGPIAQRDPNIEHTIFVGPHGSDTRTGRTVKEAISSLEKAVELVTELSLEDGPGTPTLVNVFPGEYVTEGHLDWPDNCSIVSVGGARKTRIVPAAGFEVRNVFRLGNGGYVDGFSFEGWRIDTLGKEYNPVEQQDEDNWIGDAEGNPSEGFAIAFRPGAIINRVPYAHNIVAFRGQPAALVTAPLDRSTGNPAVGNGMGVVIADRAVISEYSAYPNIMTWGATPSVPNGIGYYAKNGALLNPVNAISLWCHKAFMCTGGGQMVLSGCSSQFGDYSLWSEGSTESIIPRTADISLLEAVNSVDAANAREQIVNSTDALIDQMWNKVSTTQLCAGFANDVVETFLRKDAQLFAGAIAYCFQGHTLKPMEQFTRGLFKWNGQPVYNPSCEAMFTVSFEEAKLFFGQLGISASALALVNEMIDKLIDTLVNHDNAGYKRKERSLVTAINHQWTLPMAGVTRIAVPSRLGGSGRPTRITRSVMEREGGRVRFSGQDDEGNGVFVGGLLIDAQSGELRGPPFDLAVKRTAVRTTIARSY